MEIDERKEPGISDSGRPGLVTGALIAAMLTASLIAVFYLAWKIATPSPVEPSGATGLYSKTEMF